MGPPSNGTEQGRLRTDRAWRTVRIVGTVISLALLAWLLSRQDWAALQESLGSVSAANLVLALGLLAARHFVFALRWSFLLRAQEIHLDYWLLAKLQYASLFASNFLPTTVGGDVARLAGVLSRTQDKVAGAASIMVDRALGAFGMLFVLPFSWPLIAGYLGLAVPLGAANSGSRFEVVRRSWVQLRSALRLWMGRPGALVMALLATWLGILAYLLSVWILAAGLNMPVGLAEVAGATGLTYFISLLPLSINAYGLREISVVLFYTELGSTIEQSAALALLTRLVLITISLPGALTLGGVVINGAPEIDPEIGHEQY